MSERNVTLRLVGTLRPTPPAKPRPKHSLLVPGTGMRATRTMVTRTDTGSKNARLHATRAERAPHGAVNPRSDAQYVALPAPMTYPTIGKVGTRQNVRPTDPNAYAVPADQTPAYYRATHGQS